MVSVLLLCKEAGAQLANYVLVEEDGPRSQFVSKEHPSESRLDGLVRFCKGRVMLQSREYLVLYGRSHCGGRVFPLH